MPSGRDGIARSVRRLVTAAGRGSGPIGDESLVRMSALGYSGMMLIRPLVSSSTHARSWTDETGWSRASAMTSSNVSRTQRMFRSFGLATSRAHRKTLSKRERLSGPA